MHVDEQFAKLLQDGQWDAPRVDARPAAAAATGQLAGHDQRAVFGLEAVFVEQRTQLSLWFEVEYEDPFHQRALRARTNDLGAKAVAKERTDGVDQDRFACSCLTGDHVEPTRPLNPQLIENREILDRQLLEHPIKR